MKLPMQGRQTYSHLTVLGIALCSVLLGILLSRGYATSVYTFGFNDGKAKAEKEFNIKKLLADKELANKACFKWWFSDQHRLSKKP